MNKWKKTVVLCGLVAAGSLAAEAAAVTRTYRESAEVTANPGQGWTTTGGSYARYEKFLAVGARPDAFDPLPPCNANLGARRA